MLLCCRQSDIVSYVPSAKFSFPGLFFYVYMGSPNLQKATQHRPQTPSTEYTNPKNLIKNLNPKTPTPIQPTRNEKFVFTSACSCDSGNYKASGWLAWRDEDGVLNTNLKTVGFYTSFTIAQVRLLSSH